jgi:adenosylcobyric acid synthase
VRTVKAAAFGVEFGAYEIHLGRTVCETPLAPFARLNDGQLDGVCSGRVLGTYLHGALEHRDLARALFGFVSESSVASHDQLADWFEENADLDRFEEFYL